MKGSIGVSDIILFWLFVLLLGAIFIVLPLEPGSDEEARVTVPETEKFTVISFLRSPVSQGNADLNSDGERDVENVVDLVASGYRNQQVRRNELKEEISDTVTRIAEIESIQDVAKGTAYSIIIEYPNNERVRVGRLVDEADEVLYVPLPDGERAKISYGWIKRPE